MIRISDLRVCCGWRCSMADQRTRALERRHDTEPTPETGRALVRDLERRLGKRVTVGEPVATAWVALHRGKPMRAGPTRASVTAPLRFDYSGVSWGRMEEWGFTVAEFALYPMGDTPEETNRE